MGGFVIDNKVHDHRDSSSTSAATYAGRKQCRRRCSAYYFALVKIRGAVTVVFLRAGEAIDYGIGYRGPPSSTSTVILSCTNVQELWLQGSMRGLVIFSSVDSNPRCSVESSSDPLVNWRIKGLGVATCAKHEGLRSD